MVIMVLLIMVAALLTGLGGPALLRRLPEPVPPEGADPQTLADYADKIKYREIAGPGFAVSVGVAAAAGTTLALLTQPVAYWGCWVAYGCFAVLLAGIDARTTWLPTPVTYAGSVVLAATVVLAVVLLERDRSAAVITVVAGAVIAGVGYFLLWLISRGRGVAFGDVRLMPLVGAIAGTMSWSGVYWSILLGSVVGALIGVVRLVRGLRGPFPYAPALVSGPYAAALLLAVL